MRPQGNTKVVQLYIIRVDFCQRESEDSYFRRELLNSVLTPEFAGVRDKDGCVMRRGAWKSVSGLFHSRLPIQVAYSDSEAMVPQV